MKKSIMLLAVMFLASCAPINVSTNKSEDVDFSRLKTYAWARSTLEIDDKGKIVNEASEKVASMADRNIRPITDAALSKKGYKLAEDASPDFVISYVARGRAQSTLPQNVRTQTYGNNEQIKLGTFLMGSLSFVVYDNTQRSVIWRGLGSTPVTGTGESSERLEKVINKIFKEFPSAK